jgi:hypothetical protein
MRETVLAHIKDLTRYPDDPRVRQVVTALEECLRLAGQAEQLKEIVIDLRSRLTYLE